jgi:Zn-dependent peptidase ImmA (M78 family)/transcriptional regulator with XRE-family HTH domain
MQNTTDNEDIKGRVGLTIRALRQQRHLQQGELAKLVHMTPAQLCNIEKGKNQASIRTLTRISNALDVALIDIIQPKTYIKCEDDFAAMPAGEPTPQAAGAPSGEKQPRATITRVLADGQTLPEDLAKQIENKMKRYLDLEDRCHICKASILPLRMPFTVSDEGAEMLAAHVRTFAGVGSAILYDYPELLENLGLRILFLKMPADIQSVSFRDAENENVFIFLSTDLTPERQLFRLFYELGLIFLSAKLGCRPIYESKENREFAKRFAATFLMPRESVLATLGQLNLRADKWTYELLLRIKARFSVSAEAFTYRLCEVGALSRELCDQFIQRIHAEYGQGDKCHEPNGSRRNLVQNERFDDLALRAKIKDDPAPAQI